MIRIAMWSGPRNISTAMMRAWENRIDTCVVDEPFYACYLNATGVVHPMQQEILASQSSDWQEVIDTELNRSGAQAETIQYQKHMTHHMVADIDLDWFATLRHAFLVRNPYDVVASYTAKREQVAAEDVGFARQRELFDLVSQLSDTPAVVIDSKQVLLNPEAELTRLCNALDVPFDTNMLTWPAGRRDSDGVWASHWYQSVERSTGFAAYKEKQLSLSRNEREVAQECLPDYEYMMSFT